MDKEAESYTSAVRRYFKSDKQYKDFEAKLKTAVQKHMKGMIDKSEAFDAFSSYEKYIRTKDFFKEVEKDMKYKTGSKNLKEFFSSGMAGASPGNKKGSAGRKGAAEGVTGVKMHVQNKVTQNAPMNAKKKVPEVANTHGKRSDSSLVKQNASKDAKKKVLETMNTPRKRSGSSLETTGDKETMKDDSYEIGEELKKKLELKEAEMKEITEQLQSLAKEFSIQGDSPVEIIHQISRELKTAKEQSNQEQTKRNVKELESSQEDVKKAVFGVQKVKDKDHDIEKTKETIQDLQRQVQELFDLKTAVLNPKKAKNFKLTQSAEETLQRVQALHRQEQELLDLKTAVLNPKKTKDFKLTQSAEETLQRVQALHGTEEVCSEWKKLVFHEELQKLASTDYLEQSQHTVENAKILAQKLIRTVNEHNGKIHEMEKQISDLKSQRDDTEAKKQRIQKSKEEIERKLNGDLKKLQSEKERLLTRLSEVAGTRLTAGNPNITDLSDSNRPTKIAEQFSELYDNLWTDVFEQLTNNCKMSDREAIDNLLIYLETSYASCKDIFTQRYRNIVGEFTVWKLVAPDENSSQKKGNNTPRAKKPSGEEKEKTTITTEEIQKLQGLLNSNSAMDGKIINPVLAKFGLDVTNLNYIKNLLKTTAEETSAFVEEAIWKQMIENPTGGKPILEFVKPYVKKCVRLCWLMVAHDPPVYIKPSEKRGTKFDKEYYREFLATGKELDYVVWPALLLHENGPLLHKGVAQPMAKK